MYKRQEQGFGEELLTVKLQNFCTIDEIAKEVGEMCIRDSENAGQACGRV